MEVVLVAIVHILLAVFCQTLGAPIDERIIGGELANLGDFPYLVSLTENSRHFCSGFIYSETWVVTTAKCVSGKSSSSLGVVVGQLSLTQTDPYEKTIGVFKTYIFNQYNASLQIYDIALIQLLAPIDLSNPDEVDFIRYNEVDLLSPDAIVMGWGASMDGGFESTKLRYADVDINSDATCGSYSSTEYNVASMICAQSLSTDTSPGAPCQYDEGSPLVQEINGELIAVGVMSKNKACAVDAPSVYTRLSIYYAWLQKTAGLQPPRPTGNPPPTDPTDTPTDPVTVNPPADPTDTPSDDLLMFKYS